MEQCTIIITILRQLQEVVTMDGSLVVKANYDVAQHGLNLYFCHKLSCFLVQNKNGSLDMPFGKLIGFTYVEDYHIGVCFR